jgi:2OG-Fe(II) oxygenase superfamily
LYYLGNFVRGILLVNDEFGGLGYFNHRTLITRLARQTNKTRSKLQTVAKAAKNTLEHQAMVGLVISRDFQKLSVTFREDEKFGVSGFWHLSYLFAVRSEGPLAGEVHHDLMACLVYSGPRKTMWWTLAEDETPASCMNVLAEGETVEEVLSQETCSACNEPSCTIFQEGWVCTNITCAELGKDHSRQPLPTQTYLRQLLQPWVSQQQLDQAPPPLLPEVGNQIQLAQDDTQNLAIMRDFWKGWVCSACQTMNRRRLYSKVVCRCGWSSKSSPPKMPLGRVAGKEFLTLDADSEPPHRSIREDSVKLIQREFTDKYAIYTWEFGPEARVTALYPRAVAHEGPDGNNKIFEALEEKVRTGVIPMERVPFIYDTGSKAITRQFCANFGQSYKTSMRIDTTSFEQADPLIRDLIQQAEAVIMARVKLDVDFNEAFLLAYLPEMAIGWHNDGETGLGDVVCSRSFGADSIMKFAMHGDYWAGHKRTSIKGIVLTPDDPHLRGCLKMEERRGLLEKHQNGELTKEEYEAQLKGIVSQHKLTQRRVSPTLLSLTIPHGGYIIMSGKNMQKHYQHSAETTGLLRFVITMRSIGEQHDELTWNARRRAAEGRSAATSSVLGKRKERSA